MRSKTCQLLGVPLRGPLLPVLGLCLLQGACSPGQQPQGQQAVQPASAVSTPAPEIHADYAHANELGMVPVLMYHHFGDKEGRWTRSWSNFERDLEFLYANGYVTANARDFADGFDVPAGKKPVVISFDDGNPEQFVAAKGRDGKDLFDARGQIVPDPRCAVGILDAFAKTHPGFGTRATFFLLPGSFGGGPHTDDKLRYLVATGREIGDHTWHHPDLSKFDVAHIEQEVGYDSRWIHQAVPGYAIESFAYPYGLVPHGTAERDAVTQGSYEGEHYHFKVKFLVGANPSYSPFSKAFDPLAIPRIQPIDATSLPASQRDQDQFKLWFNRTDEAIGKVTENFPPYVSDGDPTKVTFPKKLAKYLNPAALAGREANPFDPALAAKQEKTAQAVQKKKGLAGAAEAATPAIVAALGSTRSLPGFAEPLPPGGAVVDGKVIHTLAADQTLGWVAAKYLKFTSDYTYDRLLDDLRTANHIHGDLQPGAKLVIPNVLQAPYAPHTVPVAADFPVKGIYITAPVAGSDEVFRVVDAFRRVGGNSVVIDAKDMDGVVTFHHSDVPLVNQLDLNERAYIPDLPKLIAKLHAMGIHVIMREALFDDKLLAHKMPQWDVVSKRTGKPWPDNAGIVQWVDPSLPAVQDYEIALAKELAGMGADEIQFDYVRFPAMGDTLDCKYHFDQDHIAKSAIVAGFLARAYAALHPMGVLVSADVYGTVAWNEPIDVEITGQDLTALAPHLDAISPMLYPSHFKDGYDHIGHPADHPYHFLNEGVSRTVKKIAGTRCVVRPWMQAFPLRVTHFGPGYVTAQLEGAKDAGADGWLMWNAAVRYDEAFDGIHAFDDGVTVAKE